VGAASAPRFFEYDPDNNLIAAHAGPTNWSFRCNAQNQMAWSQLKVNGTVADERCYLYDGLDCIAEVTPNGTLLREFIRNGAIGGIVAEKIHNDPTVPSEYRNSTLYYHYNHRGDTVSVSDGNGTHIWQSDYDAFGRPLPVKSASGAFAPRYTFSTKRYFPELGACYYGHRWYLPELCRWLQKDPLADVAGLNAYRFVRNSPALFVDTDGLIDVFFTGFGDQTFGGGGVEAAKSLGIDDANIYGWNESEKAKNDIREALKKNPCEKVNLYGHSYGADTAKDVAEDLGKEGISVDNLVTLDGAGGRMSSPKKPDNVNNWVNIHQPSTANDFVANVPGVGHLYGAGAAAVGGVASVAGALLDSDSVRDVRADAIVTGGGQCNRRGFADENIETSLHHNDPGGMSKLIPPSARPAPKPKAPPAAGGAPAEAGSNPPSPPPPPPPPPPHEPNKPPALTPKSWTSI